MANLASCDSDLAVQRPTGWSEMLPLPVSHDDARFSYQNRSVPFFLPLFHSAVPRMIVDSSNLWLGLDTDVALHVHNTRCSKEI